MNSLKNISAPNSVRSRNDVQSVSSTEQSHWGQFPFKNTNQVQNWLHKQSVRAHSPSAGPRSGALRHSLPAALSAPLPTALWNSRARSRRAELPPAAVPASSPSGRPALPASFKEPRIESGSAPLPASPGRTLTPPPAAQSGGSRGEWHSAPLRAPAFRPPAPSWTRAGGSGLPSLPKMAPAGWVTCPVTWAADEPLSPPRLKRSLWFGRTHGRRRAAARDGAAAGAGPPGAPLSAASARRALFLPRSRGPRPSALEGSASSFPPAPRPGRGGGRSPLRAPARSSVPALRAAARPNCGSGAGRRIRPALPGGRRGSAPGRGRGRGRDCARGGSGGLRAIFCRARCPPLLSFPSSLSPSLPHLLQACGAVAVWN